MTGERRAPIEVMPNLLDDLVEAQQDSKETQFEECATARAYMRCRQTDCPCSVGQQPDRQ